MTYCPPKQASEHQQQMDSNEARSTTAIQEKVHTHRQKQKEAERKPGKGESDYRGNPFIISFTGPNAKGWRARGSILNTPIGIHELRRDRRILPSRDLRQGSRLSRSVKLIPPSFMKSVTPVYFWQISRYIGFSWMTQSQIHSGARGAMF
jgi:hypothetical protein